MKKPKPRLSATLASGAALALAAAAARAQSTPDRPPRHPLRLTATGFGYAQNTPAAASIGRFDLSNAHGFIQKTTGLVPFFPDIGA